MMKRTTLMIAVLLALLAAACGEPTGEAAGDAGAAPGMEAVPGTEAADAGADATGGDAAGQGGGQEAAQAGAEQPLTFATGRQGGSQYPISVALAQIMETTPSIGTVTLTPGGGAANVVAVNEGQAELGITLSMSAVDGYDGEPPYEGPLTEVAHLLALHPFKLVIIVGADSGIDTVEDLRGRSVNVGPAGFTSVVVSEMLFQQVYGFEPGDLDIRNLTITDAVDQFRNNQLDALFYTPSDRFAPYIDLAQGRDVKVLEIDEQHRQAMLDLHPSFSEAEFPTEPGVYRGLDEPVPTVGFSNTIIVNSAEVDEQMGYEMVKAVAEQFDAVQAVEPSLEVLEPSDLAAPVEGMPLHPGAERYFSEQGWSSE